MPYILLNKNNTKLSSIWNVPKNNWDIEPTEQEINNNDFVWINKNKNNELIVPQKYVLMWKHYPFWMTNDICGNCNKSKECHYDDGECKFEETRENEYTNDVYTACQTRDLDDNIKCAMHDTNSQFYYNDDYEWEACYFTNAVSKVNWYPVLVSKWNNFTDKTYYCSPELREEDINLDGFTEFEYIQSDTCSDSYAPFDYHGEVFACPWE